MKLILNLAVLGAAIVLAGCSASPVNTAQAVPDTTNSTSNITANMPDKVTKTDAEWKKELTPEQYNVLREKGTERAFTGKYWDTKDPGVYHCAGCGAVLFKSEAKFDSGCGWPSFDAPVSTNAVVTHDDNSYFMHRTEVLCPKCGGHLGHVFDDGPTATGLRYCINSASIKLEKKPDDAGKTNAP
jgi:peptide-methionine (R)-S-oxide reductase